MKLRTTFVLAVLAAAAVMTSAMRIAAAEPTSKITILYDAFGTDAAMKKDWGFSALVEISGKRILFDTGNDSDIFAANIKAKNIDLTNIDFVVLSHRHSDHMAGLNHVLSVNPTVKIYAPKEGFGIYGSSLPSSFYRKDESLPQEMRYYDGKPPEVMTFGAAWQRANIEPIDKTTEIAPGITLIALVSDAPGTKELKELSLAVNTADGVVLVVGCAHPGIEKIVEAAKTINPRIRLIAGGFHLVVASDETIAKAVAALKDGFKVETIAPGHCTGEPTFAALKQAFGDRYLYAGVGTSLTLDPAKGVRRGEGPAIQDDDLAIYRKLAQREDPFGIFRARQQRTRPSHP
ncbi:MBL fold metallo-hydrolase [Bradyrhizobium sp. WSM 1738]|uniref:MBL fold metallo-hydrolase n=1 Tax=Bradyrhizobium hereditatis TaxID=2821405 RepID=UPI001CE27CD5|nr:MBL fold metallo-hydrolase [Bradyrhizobium hereditatis]MCA6119048.1 MBL fold metallo-hydrolase [Bradyrhizobium hereditatis]